MAKREEEKEEGEEEKEGYLRRRGFLTIQKAPVARKHHEIVYLGPLFSGRAIRSGGLVIPTLLFMLKAAISSHTFCLSFSLFFWFSPSLLGCNFLTI